MLGLHFWSGFSSSFCQWGLLSSSGGQASHRSGFACYGTPALRSQGFGSCSSWAREHQLNSLAQGFSCSTASGIFLDQGPNPWPLHWQADSLPLSYQGSPADDFHVLSLLHPQALSSVSLLPPISSDHIILHPGVHGDGARATWHCPFARPHLPVAPDHHLPGVCPRRLPAGPAQHPAALCGQRICPIQPGGEDPALCSQQLHWSCEG